MTLGTGMGRPAQGQGKLDGSGIKDEKGQRVSMLKTALWHRITSPV